MQQKTPPNGCIGLSVARQSKEFVKSTLRETYRSLLALVVVAVCAAAAEAPAVDVFPAVPEIRAVRRVAALELDAIVDPSNGYPTFAYHALAGVLPTVRVQPGESIELTVHNALPRVREWPNDVNIHFHGLTVPPVRPGDDVLTTIAHPGQTLHYRVRIPRDAEPGLYWYHPHAHGETYRQITGGMSGAIVVEGIARHLPALAKMVERIVVLRDVAVGAGPADEDMPRNAASGRTPMPGMPGMPAAAARKRASTDPCRAEDGLQPTLNRQPRARIGIEPGEQQFFRVVNASAARYFDLSVDGALLELVARDGVPLDAYPGTPAFAFVRHLVLPPAGRAEFVVRAPQHRTVLRSTCYDGGPAGDANPATVLAELLARREAFGTPGPAVAPGDAPVRPAPLTAGGALPPNVLSVAAPAPAVRRTLRLTEDDAGFYIDGKAFDMHAAPAIVAHAGTVERWTLVNETDEEHAFHIHQVHFAVESVDGRRVTQRSWQDVASVPRRRRAANGRTIPGSLTITVDFRDPIVRGTFVYHCHILDHEDQGMMAKIRVI
jgi:suppressor of ftsI